MVRHTQARVDLEAIRHNVEYIRAGLDTDTKYMAVVKANAYGHGMTEVASFLQNENLADAFAVAIFQEGIALRECGITRPILILGPAYPDSMQEVVDNDLLPAIQHESLLLPLQKAAARRRKEQGFHIKVDTGMNRIGIRSEEVFRCMLRLLPELPNLRFDGLFSHFAVAEIPDKSYTIRQTMRFRQYVNIANELGYHPLAHIANSAAALDLPDMQFDMVRGGIAMYGYHPAGLAAKAHELRPAMTFRSVVTDIKLLEIGEGVSYGLRFVAKRPTRVATVAVGYGDGYHRSMSGKAEMLISGRRVQQIGAICMDQCMCDITELPWVRVGQEVILIGRQGAQTISADEAGRWADTISYEMLLSVSARVPRIYGRYTDKGDWIERA